MGHDNAFIVLLSHAIPSPSLPLLDGPIGFHCRKVALQTDQTYDLLLLNVRLQHFWNPLDPKFHDYLVYGAGKPRCVVPLEVLKQASSEVRKFVAG